MTWYKCMYCHARVTSLCRSRLTDWQKEIQSLRGKFPSFFNKNVVDRYNFSSCWLLLILFLNLDVVFALDTHLQIGNQMPQLSQNSQQQRQQQQQQATGSQQQQQHQNITQQLLAQSVPQRTLLPPNYVAQLGQVITTIIITAVSTKVVPRKCKNVRGNAD